MHQSTEQVDCRGFLRLDRTASPPWAYRGVLNLPSGRCATIAGRVAEDAAGKFFELRAAMMPGMSAVELEEALASVERESAEKVIREGRALADFADDEMPF